MSAIAQRPTWETWLQLQRPSRASPHVVGGEGVVYECRTTSKPATTAKSAYSVASARVEADAITATRGERRRKKAIEPNKFDDRKLVPVSCVYGSLRDFRT